MVTTAMVEGATEVEYSEPCRLESGGGDSVATVLSPLPMSDHYDRVYPWMLDVSRDQQTNSLTLSLTCVSLMMR
jgi:hypothetical protein